jgi:hypothetical protein
MVLGPIYRPAGFSFCIVLVPNYPENESCSPQIKKKYYVQQVSPKPRVQISHLYILNKYNKLSVEKILIRRVHLVEV